MGKFENADEWIEAELNETLDEMFEAPSRKDITKIIIDEENVKNDIPPKMVLKESKDDKTA